MKTHYWHFPESSMTDSASIHIINHHTACGFVRSDVSRNGDKVDCKLCLKSDHMKHYHQINATGTDSQGCI